MNKKDILDEISSLTNSDLSNFTINSTKFGDLINKINQSSEKKKSFNHIRNKTSFNFDFSKGTMNTTLLTENNIIHEEGLEEKENSAVEKFLKKRRTKSENFERSSLNVTDILNNENDNNNNNSNEENNNNNEENNEENNPRNNKLLAKTLVPDIKNIKNGSLGNLNKNILNEKEKNSLIEEKEDDNSMIENENINNNNLSDNIESQMDKFKNENKDISMNDLNKEIPIKLKTNNKIDIIEKNQRKFFCGIFNENFQKKLDEINSETKDELSENSNENLYTYDLIKISKIENLTVISNQENVSAMTIDIDNLVYCGTSKGKVIIYDLNDGKVKKVFDNPFEKLYLTCATSIYCISVINDYFVCGFSNGFITLYYKKGNKIKLFKDIKNITSESIIDIKLYSSKNKVSVFSSDMIGNIYKTKVKCGWFKDSINSNLIFTNEVDNINNNNNNNHIDDENEINTDSGKNLNKQNNVHNPYYLIEIHSINHRIIGIANKIGFYLYFIKKKIKNKLFEFLIPKSNYYLPTFFFGKDLNANKVFLSIDNLINIYSIDNNNIVNLESVYHFHTPIAKIGPFINDLLYLFDKSQNITLVNYTFQKSLNFNFIKGNDAINISNKNVDLFVNKVIFNYQNRNFYPTYNNSLCSTNNGTILINGTKKIQFIESLNPKDCIMKIFNDLNHLKWETLFNLFIQIYHDKHPLWKLSQIPNFKNLFSNISIQFLELLLPNICILEGHNKEIANKEIQNFIKFLFQVELIDFITFDNFEKSMYKIFADFNLENYFFELLEPFIIKDKLKMDGIPNSFIINMIDEYVKNNKKEWLCQLLIHFSPTLFLKESSIFEKIIENNLFNIEIFLINKKLENNEKEENDNILSIDIFQSIKSMTDYINSNEEDNENEELKNIDIDIYDDKIVYSNDYIKLKILWYINDILENEFSDKNKENYINFINNVFQFLISKKGFDLFNLNFSNEYFFTIENLLINPKIYDFDGLNKNNIINDLYNIVKEEEKRNFEFFNLIINIINKSNIEVKNQLKFQTIIYFMNYDYDNISDEKFNKDFESQLINILSSIDSITLDENKLLITSSKKCETKYELLFKYIKDNFCKE